MSLFSSLFGSGTSQLNRSAAEADRRLLQGRNDAIGALDKGRGDINAGYDAAQGFYRDAAPGLSDLLKQGFGDAANQLRSGYGDAQNSITDALGRQRADLTSQYGSAEDAIAKGIAGANSALDPFLKSGINSQNLYDTAMGTGAGGAQGAKDFYANYASNDPFRNYRDELANKQLAAQFNGRGLGGSGRAATAMSRASLERGTQDLNTYLDRIERAAGRGQQVAGQVSNNSMAGGQQIAGIRTGLGNQLSGVEGQAGQSRANLQSGLGTALANNSTNQGSALTQLGLGLTGARAGLETQRGMALNGNQQGISGLYSGYGQQSAANEINLGNALNQARQRPAQNLISMLGIGASMFGPRPSTGIGPWSTSIQRP